MGKKIEEIPGSERIPNQAVPSVIGISPLDGTHISIDRHPRNSASHHTGAPATRLEGTISKEDTARTGDDDGLPEDD